MGFRGPYRLEGLGMRRVSRFVKALAKGVLEPQGCTFSKVHYALAPMYLHRDHVKIKVYTV